MHFFLLVKFTDHRYFRIEQAELISLPDPRDAEGSSRQNRSCQPPGKYPLMQACRPPAGHTA